MMIRYLLTLGICLLSHPLFALEEPQEYKTSLANGVNIYIEPLIKDPQWNSFRVIFVHPSLNETLYTFDTQTAEWDSINDFFLACAKEALSDENLQEIAVIATGDFPPSEMLELIKAYFEPIHLGTTLVLENEIEQAAELLQDLTHYANSDSDSVLCLADSETPSTHRFYQLPLSTKEMALIDSIISSMAENNLIQLAFNRRSIEKKGKKIEHVHPLRFMGYILSTRSLKDNARTIKKSSFKWDAFIDGFSKRMKEELGRNNVYPHIPGFAQLVGSSPEHVTPYIQRKDFEGLVKSLL